MSNLMNQARLKVLKARDDMITVRDISAYVKNWLTTISVID